MSKFAQNCFIHAYVAWLADAHFRINDFIFLVLFSCFLSCFCVIRNTDFDIAKSMHLFTRIVNL